MWGLMLHILIEQLERDNFQMSSTNTVNILLLKVITALKEQDR